VRPFVRRQRSVVTKSSCKMCVKMTLAVKIIVALPHHPARTTHKTRSVDQKLMDSIDHIVKGSCPLALNMKMSSF
jgi:hypothetical protein